MTNHLYEHGKPPRHVRIYYRCYPQLTTYINMANHLFKHDKPLKHVLIYSNLILS